jgi:hypothetical protein
MGHPPEKLDQSKIDDDGLGLAWLITRDGVRRIAAIIAKLPELVRKAWSVPPSAQIASYECQK